MLRPAFVRAWIGSLNTNYLSLFSLRRFVLLEISLILTDIWTQGRCFFNKFHSLGIPTARMCRHEYNWLRGSQFNLVWYFFRIHHMSTDIWTLERCLFVRFSCSPRLSLRICRRVDHWLCKSHFISSFHGLGICFMRTNIWARVLYFFVFLFCLLPLLRTSVGARIIDYLGLISFWRFGLSESIIFLLTFQI